MRARGGGCIQRQTHGVYTAETIRDRLDNAAVHFQYWSSAHMRPVQYATTLMKWVPVFCITAAATSLFVWRLLKWSVTSRVAPQPSASNQGAGSALQTSKQPHREETTEASGDDNKMLQVAGSASPRKGKLGLSCLSCAAAQSQEEEHRDLLPSSEEVQADNGFEPLVPTLDPITLLQSMVCDLPQVGRPADGQAEAASQQAPQAAFRAAPCPDVPVLAVHDALLVEAQVASPRSRQLPGVVRFAELPSTSIATGDRPPGSPQRKTLPCFGSDVSTQLSNDAAAVVTETPVSDFKSPNSPRPGFNQTMPALFRSGLSDSALLNESWDSSILTVAAPFGKTFGDLGLDSSLMSSSPTRLASRTQEPQDPHPTLASLSNSFAASRQDSLASRNSSLTSTTHSCASATFENRPGSGPVAPHKRAHDSSAAPALEIVIIAGPEKGKRFYFNGGLGQVHVGRLPTCNLSISDPEISGKHAMFSCTGKDWTVVDVGSMNGTILNNRVISSGHHVQGDSHVLHHADVLQLGSSTVLLATIVDHMPPKRQNSTGSELSSLVSPQGRLGGSAVAVSSSQGPSGRLSPQLSTINFAGARLECAVLQKVGLSHSRTNDAIEDVACWQCPYGRFAKAGLFCIFDGHNGRRAAELAQQKLPQQLLHLTANQDRLFHDNQSGLREQLTAAFLNADKDILADEGCTATAIVVEQDEEGVLTLQVANVGDSGVLLVDGSGDWHCLTEDHRIAHNPAEQERILRESGKNTDKRLYGLNIARTLGDKCLKDENVGFSAVPFVSKVQRVAVGKEAMLVAASDGLWDVVGMERAFGKIVSEGNQDDVDISALAQALLAFALQQGSRDDITIMVVHFFKAVSPIV